MILLKLLLLPLVCLVLFVVERFILFLAGVCAMHHVRKQPDQDAGLRPKYPGNSEEAVAFLRDPAFDAVKELYVSTWKYHSIMNFGLIVGIMLLAGITLQIPTLWGIFAFMAVLLIYPLIKAPQSARKQVEAWSDIANLKSMDQDELMKQASALNDIADQYSSENQRKNEKRRKWLGAVSLSLVLLLGGLQANYCLGVREPEPGILQRAGYQYQLREDGTAEVVRYVGIWKKTRVPAELRGHPVTSIAAKAFTCPSGDYRAFGRKEMTEILLPDSLTEIGDHAFDSCRELTSMTIPSGVTRIGDGAFSDCRHLRHVTLPEELREIGDKAFSGCSIEEIKLPEGLRSIGALAFQNCIFKAVNIPDSVREMGDNPFASCWGLREITVSDQHPAFFVQDGALCRREGRVLICCPDMDSVVSYRVPDGILEIGGHVFGSARSLQQVTLPEGLTGIGAAAFKDCYELTKVTLPDSLASIGRSAFSSCSQLKEIKLPAGLTSIGEYAFSFCRSLTEIDILPGVTEISSGLFEYDTDLRRVTIPEGVTAICLDAFSSCNSLESLVIPESVSKIEGHWRFVLFSGKTILIVTPGSYAEEFCREQKLTWQYPDA